MQSRDVKISDLIEIHPWSAIILGMESDFCRSKPANKLGSNNSDLTGYQFSSRFFIPSIKKDDPQFKRGCSSVMKNFAGKVVPYGAMLAEIHMRGSAEMDYIINPLTAPVDIVAQHYVDHYWRPSKYDISSVVERIKKVKDNLERSDVKALVVDIAVFDVNAFGEDEFRKDVRTVLDEYVKTYEAWWSQKLVGNALDQADVKIVDVVKKKVTIDGSKTDASKRVQSVNDGLANVSASGKSFMKDLKSESFITADRAKMVIAALYGDEYLSVFDKHLIDEEESSSGLLTAIGEGDGVLILVSLFADGNVLNAFQKTVAQWRRDMKTRSRK